MSAALNDEGVWWSEVINNSVKLNERNVSFEQHYFIMCVVCPDRGTNLSSLLLDLSLVHFVLVCATSIFLCFLKFESYPPKHVSTIFSTPPKPNIVLLVCIVHTKYNIMWYRSMMYYGVL